MQGQTLTPQLKLDIKRIEEETELYSQEKLCYEAQILRVYHVSFFLSSQPIQKHSQCIYSPVVPLNLCVG